MLVATLGNDALYGRIEYEDLPKGFIKITNDFTQKFCKLVTLPIVGKKFVHKVMFEPVQSALLEIESQLEIDPDASYIEEFQVFNPRHQWYLKNKALSMHAWALAFDINPSDNLPATHGNMPSIIVETFKKHGFIWGGDWKNLDPMHFELKIK